MKFKVHVPSLALAAPLFALPLFHRATLSPEHREILSHLDIVHLPDGQGGQLKTLRISRINVQIVNGTGATNGVPGDPDSFLPQSNGLGNLILGYNELGNVNGDERTGSHNLVVGQRHTYTSVGGIVVGDENTLLGRFATAAGGARNTVYDPGASIVGGEHNIAYGTHSTIVGGERNETAGRYAVVAGGTRNRANGYTSFVGGGWENLVTGYYAVVAGGRQNHALGSESVVSGGRLRTAQDPYSWVGGGLVEAE